MARISIDREHGLLAAEFQGLDKLWTLKSRLEVPPAHVRGATHDPGFAREPKGLRVGGTHLPGVITADRFRLADAETYDRLVIEVDDPRAAVALIEQSIPRA
ncbi:hypothetical protein E1298_09560 [Actinomadura rubrisoli]|uniref:Uncharacterized protein n=2 Tax=Actinomadura rubrisoli TaxID=2530368 RepID=A0A4R5C8R5_9ACTN|nr:hypothetical protein E1298_09560 [Actinomadura rubrisoli]